jgi:hypothetical protein
MHSLHNDRPSSMIHPWTTPWVHSSIHELLTDRGIFISDPSCADPCVRPDTCQPASSPSSLDCDIHCLYLSISEFSTRCMSGPFFRVPAAIPSAAFQSPESWLTPPALFTRRNPGALPTTTIIPTAGATALTRAHNLLENHGRRGLDFMSGGDCYIQPYT